MVSLFRARPSALRLGALLLVRDQAAVAFSSAAVLRPAGSSLMPLRRTPRRPDLARLRLHRCIPSSVVIFALDRVQGRV